MVHSAKIRTFLEANCFSQQLPKLRVLLSCVLLVFSLLIADYVQAQSQPATSITTSTQPASDSSYTGHNGNAHTWGNGDDLLLEAITTSTGTYSQSMFADNIIVRRVDNAKVVGNRCALFAERTSSVYTLAPSLQCDPATVMSGRIINRGWLDVFSNDGLGSSNRAENNIERIDFIFSSGIQASSVLATLENTGHIVTEKSGNNPTVMAAITSLDINGDPDGYAPLVKVWPHNSGQAIRYGLVGTSTPFSFLKDGDGVTLGGASQDGEPEGFGSSTEQLGVAFVTLDDLGVALGQTYYGFSYFSQDIYGTSFDPVEYLTFPKTTSGGSSVADADMYGGVAGYFTLGRSISGNVYNDADGSSTNNTGDSNLQNITVRLYSDVNANGSLDSGEVEIASFVTDVSGNYSFNVGANASYLVLVDSNDTDIPANLFLSVTNPQAVTVVSSTISGIDFPFIPVTPSNGVISYKNTGNGKYSGSIALMDWTASSLTNGIQTGDQVTFTLPGCRSGSLTATFSNISNATNASTYVPTDMNTWSGSSMYTAYNTVGTGEALYGGNNADVGFTIDWSMMVNGVSVIPDLFVLDAEATNVSGESLAATTNGGDWSLVDSAGGTDYTVTGLGTQTFSITKSENPSNSPMFISMGTTRTDVSISAGGRQGIAFGVLLPCDYGDLPDGYGSPSHAFHEEPASPDGLQFVAGQLYLGTTPPDADRYTQNTTSADPAANSDDADSLGDDEDGVNIPTLTQGQTATITATVSGTGGYLQGWIDFDGDGAFGVGEQVATDYQDGGTGDSDTSSNGVISFDVSVPANASTSTTFARFRWSTATGLDSIAVANDGEVEDYTLSIDQGKVYQCPDAIADLWFANDESGSVSASEFDDALDFLYQVSDEFRFDDVTGVKAGITGWGSNVASAEVIMPITQSFGDSGDSGLISTVIVSDGDTQGVRELYDTKKNTSSGTRLDYATTYLTNLINVGNGRRTGVKQLAIILTDAFDYQITGTGGGSAWITAADNLRNAGPDGTKVMIILAEAAAIAYNTDNAVKAVVDAAAGVNGKVFVGATYAEIANPLNGYISGVVSEICGAVQKNDFGDAPDTYGDASHSVPASPTVYLGSTVPDDDADTQLGGDAGVGADGDDSDGADDEDGISAFPVLNDLNTSYTIPSTNITAAGVGAILHAWIDFDRSNTFDDDEYTSAIVGSDLVWSSIPTGTQVGDTYARFRLTTDGSVNATTAVGSASDGEVEDYAIAIDVGGFSVKGRVYKDSNTDGINDLSEAGVSGLPIVLLDAVNNTCVSTQTDAEGNYEFFPVIPGNYQLYEASRETVPTPQNCDVTKAKDPAGYRSTTANVIAQFSVANAEITGKDFGDINGPTFLPDNTGTVLPGNVVLYAHKFTAKSTGTVNFVASNSTTATSGWSSVIYQDIDCNGQLDGTEGNTSVGSNLPTTAGLNICLINKVYAPGNTQDSETYSNVISADFDFNGNVLAGSTRLKVTNLTKASNDSADSSVGSSRLELRKTVENITQAIAETDTQNQAKPGDVLKYRIYYSNTGSGPITDLKVNDVVPAFTSLNGAPDCQLPLPESLTTCAGNVNGEAINWSFGNGDVLKGGSSGAVSYEVIID